MMSCWASATPAEHTLSAAATAAATAKAFDIRMENAPSAKGDPPRMGRFPQPRSRKELSEPTEVGNRPPERRRPFGRGPAPGNEPRRRVSLQDGDRPWCRNFVAQAEVVVPLDTGAELRAVRRCHVDVPVRPAGEGRDVGFAVTVEIPGTGDLHACREVFLPLHALAVELRAVGKRDIDVGHGAAGEVGDVVLSVTVEVADRRDFVVDPEEVVPLDAGAEAASVGQCDVDVSARAAGEGGDVVLAVPVEVPDQRDLAVDTEVVRPLGAGAAP